MADEALHGGRRRHGDERAHELADRAAELERPAGRVGLPERHLAGLAGRRRDEHPVVGDLLDAPARGAEQERLADAALEHHLFVELADARARTALAGEEDAVEAAVGNRAAVGDGDPLRPLARGQRVLEPIPGEARPKLGELVRRIAAREHVEHAFEGAAASSANGAARRTASKSASTVHWSIATIATICCARTSSGLRGYRVLSICASCIARVTAAHATRSPRNFGTMTPRLGCADGVPGSPDALHPARDRRRRLDLDDEIDGAHVDAELERRGRDQPADESRLQAIFDLDPLRPRERPVVRADQRLAGELVERARQPLGDAPAVDEDQRRAMRLDELEQARVDRRPDRRPHGTLRRRAARDVLGLADARHVLDRHLDRQLEPLLLRRVDDGDGTVEPDRRCQPGAPLRREIARLRRAGRCVAERPMRWSAAAPAGRIASSRSSDSASGRRAWSARARGSRR